MATLHFRNSKVYMASTSAAAAVPISEGMSVSLSIEGNREEDPAFGDTWRTQQPGILQWSGSVEANYDTAQTVLFDAATQVLGPVRMYWYPDNGTTARYYSGLVWVNLEVTGDVKSVGKVTASIEGDGALATT